MPGGRNPEGHHVAEVVVGQHRVDQVRHVRRAGERGGRTAGAGARTGGLGVGGVADQAEPAVAVGAIEFKPVGLVARIDHAAACAARAAGGGEFEGRLFEAALQRRQFDRVASAGQLAAVLEAQLVLLDEVDRWGDAIGRAAQRTGRGLRPGAQRAIAGDLAAEGLPITIEAPAARGADEQAGVGIDLEQRARRPRGVVARIIEYFARRVAGDRRDHDAIRIHQEFAAALRAAARGVDVFKAYRAIEVEHVAVEFQRGVRRRVGVRQVVIARAAVAPIVVVARDALLRQLGAGGAVKIELRGVAAADFAQRFVDMPVHRDLLVHVKEPAADGHLAGGAQIEPGGEREVIGGAADIADVGAHVDVVVDISASEGLSGLGTRGIADRSDGGIRHAVERNGRADDPGGARRVLERRREAAAHLGPAHVVIDGEVVAEFIVQLAAHRGCLGADPVHPDALKLAGAVIDQEVLVIDRVVRAVAAIEPGERLHVRNLVAAQRGQRRSAGVVRFLGVGDLEQQAEVALAVGKFLGHVALDLDAVGHVEAGMKRPAPSLEIATDRETQGIVDRPAIAEVDLGFVEVDPGVETDEAAFFLAGVADVVDNCARCLRGIGRGTAAADRFDPLDAGIVVRPVIVVAELDIAEQHGGQTIFLDLDERRTAGGDGQPAHGDVRVAARTRGPGDLDPGNEAEHFGFGRGMQAFDRGGIDAGRGNRAVEFGLVLARRGHHDFVEAGGAVIVGGGNGCALRKGWRDKQADGDDGSCGYATAQNGLLHTLPPPKDVLADRKSEATNDTCNNRLQTSFVNRLQNNPSRRLPVMA